MDSSYVDTSLSINLNVNPPPYTENTHSFSNLKQKREFERDVVNLESQLPRTQEVDVLVDELNRVSIENKKLTEMLSTICEKYNGLRSLLMDLRSKNYSDRLAKLGKRKAEDDKFCNNTKINGDTDGSRCSDECSCKKPKINNMTNVSRVCVRTDASDTSLVVKDGHQWRKYGQKVTRDNPSPRAYFKCSFAPSCPVKKRVQRSAQNPSVIVATYEGEHNHLHPFRSELRLGMKEDANQGNIELDCAAMKKTSILDKETQALQQFLIDQMAFSLTKEPSCSEQLTAAISGRVLDHY